MIGGGKVDMINRVLSKEYYIRCYDKCKIKKNTVLFMSKNGADLAGNMFYLLVELQNEKYSNFNIFLSCKEDIKGWVESIFEKYGIKNVTLVEQGGKKYMQLLASAEFLFTDTSFDLRYIKKKGQVIVNTWHGTPLKLMGKRVTTCKYEYGNIQKNLAMSDYLVAPSDFMIDVMVDSYGVTNLSAGKVLYSGYPRNSVFFDRERDKKMREQLGFNGKNVYVYMPTWRGTLKKKESLRMLDILTYYFQEIDEKLDDNDIFLVKLHPFVKNEMDLSRYKHILPFPTEYETYDVLNAADGLVTDYSSVFFDFAITHKKIILFAYDYEEYKHDRGMYCDLEELPFPIVRDTTALVNEMHSGIEYDDADFLKQYCTYDRTDSAKVVCERVLLGKSGCKEAPVKNNGKENVIMYVEKLPLNGMTSAILSLLNNVDRTKRNYFACVISEGISKCPERLKKLPEDVEIIPLRGGFIMTTAEKVALKMFYKKNVNNSVVMKTIDGIFEREAQRYFGGFVYQHGIQYTGYEKDIINLFGKMHANRSIFVHNDMVQELELKGNQNEQTLRRAYASYDNVVAVSKDIYPTLFKLGATKENAKIVNNCIDYEGILERGFGEIEFGKTTYSSVSVERLKEILDSGAKKFINIARFSPEKGHAMLLDAFERYNEEDPDSYLIIIGGYGRWFKDVNSKAQSIKCKDNVILIRSMLNPMPVLKRCDLFILSSIYEGLGLVILESIIQGVPVMSTDIKGPQGFMREHGGYLVDVSADGIYEGMKKFKEEGIEPLKVDFKEYNRKAVEEFESILK